jgi:hypothetical protein
MAKATNLTKIDTYLNSLEGNRVLVCAGQPVSRADALTKALNDEAHANSIISGANYTLANGDTSGRKNTLGAISGVSFNASGTGDHIAIIDGTDLLDVTTMPSKAITSGDTGDIAAWKHETAELT